MAHPYSENPAIPKNNTECVFIALSNNINQENFI